jgi:hypothetical protein
VVALKAGSAITQGNAAPAKTYWHSHSRTYILSIQSLEWLFMCSLSRLPTYALICMAVGLLNLTACSVPKKWAPSGKDQVLIVSIPEQKMLFLENGREVDRFDISSAKKGLGDSPDSYMTPAGLMEVAEKFGDNLPLGSVLKDRQPTGEIIPVNAPGRDPIVTRVLWLRGLEEGNRNAYERFIYIHGTPQESLLGTPASFGCIRMRSIDIIILYEHIFPGAKVLVTEESIDNEKIRWVSKHGQN